MALVVTKLPHPSGGTEVDSSPLLPNSGSQSQAHPYWMPTLAPQSSLVTWTQRFLNSFQLELYKIISLVVRSLVLRDGVQTLDSWFILYLFIIKNKLIMHPSVGGKKKKDQIISKKTTSQNKVQL